MLSKVWSHLQAPDPTKGTKCQCFLRFGAILGLQTQQNKRKRKQKQKETDKGKKGKEKRRPEDPGAPWEHSNGYPSKRQKPEAGLPHGGKLLRGELCRAKGGRPAGTKSPCFLRVFRGLEPSAGSRPNKRQQMPMFSKVWGHLGAPNTAKQEEKETKTKGNRQGEKRKGKKKTRGPRCSLGALEWVPF